jgi:hypothetical protein
MCCHVYGVKEPPIVNAVPTCEPVYWKPSIPNVRVGVFKIVAGPEPVYNTQHAMVYRGCTVNAVDICDCHRVFYEAVYEITVVVCPYGHDPVTVNVCVEAVDP